MISRYLHRSLILMDGASHSTWLNKSQIINFIDPYTDFQPSDLKWSTVLFPSGCAVVWPQTEVDHRGELRQDLVCGSSAVIKLINFSATKSLQSGLLSVILPLLARPLISHPFPVCKSPLEGLIVRSPGPSIIQQRKALQGGNNTFGVRLRLEHTRSR